MKKEYPLGTLVLIEGIPFVVIGHKTSYLGYDFRGMPYGEQMMHHLWRIDYGDTGYWGEHYMKNAKILFEPKSK